MSVYQGLLERISPSLMGHLLDALSRRDPLVEHAPGGLLIPELIERLRGEGFSGYLLARFSGEERGWLAFYRGRLLGAWRQTTYSHLSGTVAYRAVQRELGLAILSLYRLQPDDLPPLVALTQGSLRLTGVEAREVLVENLVQSLVQEQFTGALVLEDGLVGQAWFLARGKYLFETLPPARFAAGVLHLVQAPNQTPPDLYEQAQQEDRAQRSLRISTAWNAAHEVLKEYMGRGASLALERLQHIYATDDPASLEKNLRRWMTESLEPNAAVLFDRLLRPTL